MGGASGNKDQSDRLVASVAAIILILISTNQRAVLIIIKTNQRTIISKGEVLVVLAALAVLGPI